MNSEHAISPEALLRNSDHGRQPVLIEPWVGVEDLAMTLGVSTDWVYEKAASGELPSYKFGGHRRFRVSEVEDWALRHANGRMADVKSRGDASA